MKTQQQLREEAAVLRLIHMLIDVEIPLPEALQLTAQEFPGWKEPLEVMRKFVAEGNEPSDGLAGHDEWFSPYVPEILSLGCKSGVLDKSFFMASAVVEKCAGLKEDDIQVKDSAEIIFLGILSVLMSMACPHLSAIKIAGQAVLPAKVIEDILIGARDGGMLLQGLKFHPEWFSADACRYVTIGECLGDVPEVCARYARVREQVVLTMSNRRDLRAYLASQNTNSTFDYDILAALIWADISPKSIKHYAHTGAIKNSAFVRAAEKAEIGGTFGDAMFSLPDDFPPYIARMVQAGEADGTVKYCFERIANYLKWRYIGIQEIRIEGAVPA